MKITKSYLKQLIKEELENIPSVEDDMATFGLNKDNLDADIQAINAVKEQINAAMQQFNRYFKKKPVDFPEDLYNRIEHLEELIEEYLGDQEQALKESKMKVTKDYLRQVIKEELEKVKESAREDADYELSAGLHGLLNARPKNPLYKKAIDVLYRGHDIRLHRDLMNDPEIKKLVLKRWPGYAAYE